MRYNAGVGANPPRAAAPFSFPLKKREAGSRRTGRAAERFPCVPVRKRRPLPFPAPEEGKLKGLIDSMTKAKFLRGALYFWTLFIGLGALAGGVCMLIEPSGAIMQMEPLLPYFQVLPLSDLLFQNYTFPGIALLVVNCVPQLIAAFLLFKKHKRAVRLCLICGVLLMLWITIQFVIFPMNALSTSYFVFGALEAVCAILYQKEQAK